MLSKREKIIALATVLVMSILVGDRYVLTPLMDRLSQWEIEKQDLSLELSEAQKLIRRRRSMERQWKAMAGEELAADAESESRVLHALDGWSQDTGLTLTSVKPLQLSKVKDNLHEMTFVVAGTGTLHATAEFIWQIERAALPLRIRDMQLGSSNEGGTEMSLQLNISALALIDAETGGKDAS